MYPFVRDSRNEIDEAHQIQTPHRLRNRSPSFISPRRSYRRLAPPSAQHLHEQPFQSVSSKGSEKGWLRMINARRTPSRFVVRGFRNGVSHSTIPASATMMLLITTEQSIGSIWQAESNVVGVSQTWLGRAPMKRAALEPLAQISLYVC